MSKEKKNTRNRNFNILCYEETIKQVMVYLRQSVENGSVRAYYCAKHKAEFDKGQEHWHIVVEFYNAKTRTAVAKNMLIDDRFVEHCTSVRASVCYLIHKYESNKIHYPVSIIESNDYERTFMFLNSRNDNEASDLMQFYRNAFSVIDSNANARWCTICRKLIADKDINPKYLARSSHFLESYYNSVRYDKEGE